MSWQEQLLALLGIPVTQQNISWMTNWANNEEPNGGFGPGYYSYYLNNPFNLKDSNGNFLSFPTPQIGIQQTAQWLQNNGGYGGTGTYAQEIKNYLMGLPNQLAKAFSYYSTGQGDTTKMGSGYQQLVNGNSNTWSISPGGSTSPWGILGLNPPGSKGSGPQTQITNPIQALGLSVESGGVFLAAVLLVVAGGLWIVIAGLTNPTANKVEDTSLTVGRRIGKIASVVPK